MLDWIIKQTPFSQAQNPSPVGFHIEYEPSIIETNSNIIVTCWKSKAKDGIVPCTFSWTRCRNGVTSSIQHAKGSTYLCDPNDLGCSIRVEVTSLDEEHPGKTAIQFPPVKIDLLTRKTVYPILSANLGSFPVFLNNNNVERECTLKLSDGMMRIIDGQTELSYKFEYTVAEPRLYINPREPTRLAIRFTEKYEDELMRFLAELFGQQAALEPQPALSLRFQSRNQKDVFIYGYRAFVGRREVKTSALITRLENLELTQYNFQPSLEIEAIKLDMARLMDHIRLLESDKVIYQAKISEMEEELQTIIMTYTKIIEDRCRDKEDFDKSYAVLADRREYLLMKKCAYQYVDLADLRRHVVKLQEDNDRLKRMTFNGGSRVVYNMTTSRRQAPLEYIECRMEEMSRINSKLLEYNKRLRYKGHSGPMNSILDALNDSEVMDPKVLHDRIDEIKKEKDALARQLQHVLRRNYELEKLYQRPNEIQQDFRRKPYTQESMLQMEQAIQKDVANFKNRLENVQKANSQVIIPGTIVSQRRIPYNSVGGYNYYYRLRRDFEEVLSLRNNLQGRCEHLVIENNYLRRKILYLENLLQYKYRMMASIPLSSENNVHFASLISYKDNTIRELDKANVFLRKQLENRPPDLTKRVYELTEENKMLRRGQDIMNRSRDLSADMDDYYEKYVDALRRQNEQLLSSNYKLIESNERYVKEVKYAARLRTEILNLKKAMEELQNLKSQQLNV